MIANIYIYIYIYCIVEFIHPSRVLYCPPSFLPTSLPSPAALSPHGGFPATLPKTVVYIYTCVYILTRIFFKAIILIVRVIIRDLFIVRPRLQPSHLLECLKGTVSQIYISNEGKLSVNAHRT